MVDPINYAGELRKRSEPAESSSDDQTHGFVWTDPPETRERHNDHPPQTDSNTSTPTSGHHPPTRNHRTNPVIDPINYDVDELRMRANCGGFSDTGFESKAESEGFVWSAPSEQYRVNVEDPTPKQRRRMLKLTGVDSDVVGEKPYLTSLPADDARSFVVDWLEYLSTEAGTDGALAALERYHEIGWITDDVERELRDSTLWVERREGEGSEALDQADHLLSFVYVAKIASTTAKGMVFY